MDADLSGAITAEEFMKFWVQVRAAGYSEAQIKEEIEELLEGGAWVDWKDGRDTGMKKVVFPARPTLTRLSAQAWDKARELFHIIDIDGQLAITRDKALMHFTSGFAKMSVNAMFNELDPENHGQITAPAFMDFWLQVRSSG